MYQIAIVVNNADAHLSLSYRLKEDAEKTYEVFQRAVGLPNIVLADDDFGYRVSIKGSSIAYVLFVDVEEMQFVNFEKDMATNKARVRIGEKLDEMGFKPQPPGKSKIIQH